MHRTTILAAFLLVAAAGAVAAQDDPAVETLFRQSCAPCHQVPDPRFETDRAWLEQIERTAWSDTPPRTRAALQAFLKSSALDRPGVVDAPQVDAPPTLAFVVPSFAEGTLFLRDERGRVTRLEWTPGGDRRRGILAGRYALAGIRVVRRTEDGHVWFTSTTANRIRDLALEPGREHAVEIDETIRIGLQARRRTGEVRAHVSILGEGGAGLSVYRNGKRLELSYAIHGSGDESIATGPIRYG